MKLLPAKSGPLSTGKIVRGFFSPKVGRPLRKSLGNSEAG
jgi:hypothetical protein